MLDDDGLVRSDRPPGTGKPSFRKFGIIRGDSKVNHGHHRKTLGTMNDLNKPEFRSKTSVNELR